MLTQAQMNRNSAFGRANRRLHRELPKHISLPTFLARFPDLTLVVLSGWYDHDEMRGGTSVTTLDAEAIYNEIVYDADYDPIDDSWADITANEKNLRVYLQEKYSEEGGASVMSEAQYKEHKAEKERKRLEETAAKFARRNGVTVGTVEFFEALDRGEERERDYRYGLQEDGLCATSGFGRAAVDEWYELRNESGSRSADIDDVREWVKENTPLLWLKYQEGKLAAQKAD